jgi:hypothetical protein
MIRAVTTFLDHRAFRLIQTQYNIVVVLCQYKYNPQIVYINYELYYVSFWSTTAILLGRKGQACEH